MIRQTDAQSDEEFPEQSRRQMGCPVQLRDFVPITSGPFDVDLVFAPKR